MYIKILWTAILVKCHYNRKNYIITKDVKCLYVCPFWLKTRKRNTMNTHEWVPKMHLRCITKFDIVLSLLSIFLVLYVWFPASCYPKIWRIFRRVCTKKKQQLSCFCLRSVGHLLNFLHNSWKGGGNLA